jgi:hypothetical protein
LGLADAYWRYVLNPVATLGLSLVLLLVTACSGIAANTATPVPDETSVSPALATSVERDPDVPPLPFPDNPDPNACGIPSLTGDYTGWVNGVYQGQVVEATVPLYDSHERLHITGRVPSGTEVLVQLYQSNPVLDFYYVVADTPAGRQAGWVPAPFLQFSPPPA